MAQRYRHGTMHFVDVIVAYDLEIEKGDMLQLANDVSPIQATLCVNAADNDTFYAIADQDHVALAVDDGNVHTIRCAIPEPMVTWEYPIETPCNVQQGTGLAIASENTLDVAATDHVALAVENKVSATGMTVKVVFLLPPLWGGASKAVSYTCATW